MNFSMTIEGNEAAAQRLAAIGQSFNNLPDAMSSIGKYIASFLAGEVFASQGGITNNPWPRLSPRYEVVKAKKFPGSPMLVRTGLLQRKFETASSGSMVRIYNTATAKGGKRYLKFLNDGTRRMPARVVMALDDTRIQGAANIVRADLERKLVG
jgi:hypothetical protein